MAAAPDWFSDQVIEGVQMLYALSLAGCPPAETVQLTAQVWIQALWGAQRCTDPALDRERLQAAFLAVARLAERWPAPRAVLDHLPARREATALAEPAISDTQRAAIVARYPHLFRRRGS